jgi:hypothetical protein
MKLMTLFSTVFLIFFVIKASTPVSAEPLETLDSTVVSSSEKSEETKKKLPEEPLGINIDLLISTNFVFRGWSTFQKDNQMDPYLYAGPSLTYSIGKTGFSIGYWGAFQFAGENIMENVDTGLNFEHDIIFTYAKQVTKKLALSGFVTFYLFPHCDKEITGTSNPTWIEPTFTANYSLSALDLGFFTSYFWGLQNEPGIRDGSYVYINPSIGKTLKLAGKPVNLKLGYGYKIFDEGNTGRNNIHDIQFTVTTAFKVKDWYIKPGAGISWTDMGKDVNDETIPHEKGLIVWTWLNIGTDK